MKRTIIATCLIFGLMTCSCSQSELQESDQYGYLTVGLADEVNADIQVKADAGTEGSEKEDIVYSLEIVDSKGNVDASYDDHRTIVGQQIELLMDRYTVKASSGVPETGFNLPYWYGENTVRIYADKEASVKVTCKMQKVKFSVHFPEEAEFTSKFEKYTLEVKSGEESLTFSSDPTEGQGTFKDTAYFVTPADRKLTYVLRMKNIDGAEYSAAYDIEGVAAAQHYHFDFTLGEREDIDGALVLNVLLDGEYKKEISHEILLNFDRLAMPSYSHPAEFDPDQEGIVYPLGNAEITKKLMFSAPRKIKSLVISHLDANLLTEGLPQVVEFVNISEERKQIVDGLGILYSEVTNESDYAEIDVTGFVKNLPISPENEPYLMSFTVIDMDNRYARCDFEFTIVSDIQAETHSSFPWSSFVILKGNYFSRQAPAGITFQYKKTTDTEWTEIDPGLIKDDPTTLTFSYRLNHLDLNTEYEFRATSDKDKAEGKTAEVKTFKTFASEGIINNLDLDDWYADGDAWYPNASSSSADWVWDTANGGTKSLSVYPTNPESTIVAVSGEGKRAAKMVSQYASVKFAAGNIYTGKFAKVNLGEMGAELDWGVTFSSRPLALRGWYRYEPQVVNEDVGAGYEFMQGKNDICQIQIFLTDWTAPFRVKAYSSGSVFVDFNNNYILAHGEITSDENTVGKDGNTNGYIPFVIPLEYRSLTQPTYLVISAAASRYGDYFTGGRGSTLYLDELELIYDPDQLTDEEFETVMKNIY